MIKRNKIIKNTFNKKLIYVIKFYYKMNKIDNKI